MPKVRGNPGQKWVRKASAATEDYAAGVQSPRQPWAASTGAAAQNWAQGVTQAASRGSFAKGVQKAGDGKWLRKSVEVGAPRFAGGVAAAQADYEAGFAPFKQVIESTTLPPRGPKGDPRNLARVAAMANALRMAKTGNT